MLYFPHSRTELLHFMPKGAEVAEIGVENGAFSEQILKITQPKCLHLIDAWKHFGVDSTYKAALSDCSQEEHDRQYQGVCEKFSHEISQGQVRLHRGLSAELAAGFASQQFDWIFIDGDHTYQGVTKDLLAYAPKVKPGGFILGHDYMRNKMSERLNYGVTPAVNDYLEQCGKHLGLMTGEQAPTYLLADTTDTATYSKLVAEIIFSVNGCLLLAGFPGMYEYRQEEIYVGEDKRYLTVLVPKAAL